MRVNSQLDCLSNLTSVLPQEHLDIQCQAVEVLISKLKIANSKLDSLIRTDENGARNQQPSILPKGSVRRSKYLLHKESLDKVIEELEKWQQIFDPSWYLIVRSATEKVDTQLAKSLGTPMRSSASSITLCSAQNIRSVIKDESSAATAVFLPESGLRDASESTIQFSNMKLVVKKGSGGSRTYILDSVSCPTYANPSAFTKNVRDLARKLAYADPETFNLLSCKGVLKHTTKPKPATSFTFVFKLPEKFSEPESLRSLLITSDKSHSLSDRFKLANQLATSVSYVHAFGFVHKNIRPETTLILNDNTGSVGSCFLAGFAHIRPAESISMLRGGSEWTSNLYHHPRRQGETPQDSYIMQHDIYSLGVCLLEIGLWTSLVSYEEQICPSKALGLRTDSPELYDPDLIKNHLVSIARKKLPMVMGTRYTEVVETCLTCLDEDNVDFGDEQEFQDEDSILVGVRYIEKVGLWI
jgi:hypothetical protein